MKKMIPWMATQRAWMLLIQHWKILLWIHALLASMSMTLTMIARHQKALQLDMMLLFCGILDQMMKHHAQPKHDLLSPVPLLSPATVPVNLKLLRISPASNSPSESSFLRISPHSVSKRARPSLLEREPNLLGRAMVKVWPRVLFKHAFRHPSLLLERAREIDTRKM